MSLVQKIPPIGQARQLEMIKAATSLTYLSDEATSLSAHFFLPADFEPSETRPTIVFFHGGFWDAAMATQFAPQCLHFAGRGAVAITVETRVKATHGTGPNEALEDSRTFLEWLASHGPRLGVDLDRVVLGGASGGAWLALQQILPKPKKFTPPIMPKALLLFSSLLDTSMASAASRFPDLKSAKMLNPMRQLRRKLPPMMLCHGKSDRVAPFDDARKFARAMKWRRNRVELVDFEKAEHSFFNFNVSDLHYELTLKAMDQFLVELDLLQPDELDGLI